MLDSTSPYENVISILKTNWDKVKDCQYDLFDISKLPRNLQGVTKFCSLDKTFLKRVKFPGK